MTVWKQKQPACGTCKFWCGERKIDFETGVVEAITKKGLCAGWHAVFRGNTTSEDESCNAWETLED
ncbi:MAG: hypothetical protein ACRCW2_11900 [Cellulosilyticaceae bacterium]